MPHKGQKKWRPNKHCSAKHYGFGTFKKTRSKLGYTKEQQTSCLWHTRWHFALLPWLPSFLATVCCLKDNWSLALASIFPGHRSQVSKGQKIEKKTKHTPNSTNNKNFFRPAVSHRTFGDFYQHSEDSFLQREAQICRRVFTAFYQLYGSVLWKQSDQDVARNPHWYFKHQLQFTLATKSVHLPLWRRVTLRMKHPFLSLRTEVPEMFSP